ncbi:MAG: DUF427 domain-containing protein [Cyclobacteriaceae bacterium]
MKKRIKPEPVKAGEESVWDYPRPPALVSDSRHVRVIINGKVVADSNKSYRVLETSHPPVFYIPASDVRTEWIKPSEQTSYCEFKGRASYAEFDDGAEQRKAVAWYYTEPTETFSAIKGYYAFYPSKADRCYVGEEEVEAQEGDFYGGWITGEIKGPFKGAADTWGW